MKIKDLLLALAILIIPFKSFAAEFGIFSPQVVFSEQASVYLSVYEERDQSNDYIKGIIIDRKGNPGASFEILKGSPGLYSLSYSKRSNMFLVTYSYCLGGCYLKGLFVSNDGTFIGLPFDIRTNINGAVKNIAIYDNSNDRFLVIWSEYNRTAGSTFYGKFIDPQGNMGQEKVLMDADYISEFDAVRDDNTNKFLVIYTDLDVSNYAVNGIFIDDNLTPYRPYKIANTNDSGSRLSLTYDNKDNLFFIAYSDYSAENKEYYIKALIMDENGNVLSKIDVANTPNIDNAFDTVYNPLSDEFIIVYQNAQQQGGASNIVYAIYSTDGQLKSSGSIDSTKKAMLYNPQLAINSLCKNGLIVYEDYDQFTYTNRFGSYLLNGPCRFVLNVDIKGKGSGSVSIEPSGISCPQVCNAEFDDGVSVTLTAVPDEKSVFAGFNVPSCGKDPLCNITMDENKNIEAYFEPKIFTITASASEGGIIDPQGDITVKAGESITFTIMPYNGYFIKSVIVDGEDVGARTQYIFENVESNHTIYAEFAPYSNEWDLDGGVNDIIADSTEIEDSQSVVTYIKEDKSSGCGCALLE